MELDFKDWRYVATCRRKTAMSKCSSSAGTDSLATRTGSLMAVAADARDLPPAVGPSPDVNEAERTAVFLPTLDVAEAMATDIDRAVTRRKARCRRPRSCPVEPAAAIIVHAHRWCPTMALVRLHLSQP